MFKISAYFLIYFLFIISYGCYEDGDNNSTTYVPRSIDRTNVDCVNVTCEVTDKDTTCYDLTTRGKQRLPKGHRCSRDLVRKSQPTRPGSEIDPNDPPLASTLITFTIPDSSLFYGFDFFREYPKDHQEPRDYDKIYISMPNESRVAIELHIEEQLFDHYDEFIIKSSNASRVSFDPDHFLDSLIINDVNTMINLYSRIEFNATIPFEITVEGRNRGEDSKLLICDSHDCDFSVWVHLFNTKEITPNIYAYNGFTIDETSFYEQAKTILKQAVFSVDTVNYTKKEDNYKDINGNNWVDIFHYADGSNPELDYFIENNENSINIVNDFKLTWVLAQPAQAGDKTLTLETTNGLNVMQDSENDCFVSQDLLYTNSLEKTDSIGITVIGYSDHVVYLCKPIENDYPKGAYISRSTAGGLSFRHFNIGFVKGNHENLHEIILHEMLHFDLHNSLLDVKSPGNLMNYNVPEMGKRLSFRELPIKYEAGTQKQWYALHEID
ncbi:hypothetical protein QA601_14150 [Chitinispirillales bacterium ANBcel5]|uniref:hypothetical protein n=1 Tax=Cellulosispirillum alkaliphilum TaxID=3039283 RepID=UPI002A53E4E2|nr:hypothetical protein [Chitinispirillales bacterium ANBcel5]